ncbi:MAG: hypothetical protein F9K16_05880 [Thermoanaerobaculia bacterium]|nr:MAG: hypothetical protein F9K16_05880 [Thermoanaerobaculia bacterium]MBZ0100790.1 hypothetical protein [Thermoanaerobaculia bacterium]
MSSILQIVPRLPPPEEALGHVALRLAEGFAARGIESRIVPAMTDRAAFQKELAAAPADQAALLHYVGYGYARRGAPLWLAGALADWLAASPGRRLAVHFHEVAAFGPPWRSSFWLAPLQRRVAARLRRLAVAAVTSVEPFVRLLERLVPESPTTLLPVFSNVGEPESLVPLGGRRAQLVLFGGPAARARIWAEGVPDLERAVRALSVGRVVEIGRDPVGPECVGGVPVDRLGELPGLAVGRVLASSAAMFFDYPVEHLAKSGVFAACCAFGVLPVCRSRRLASAPAPGEGSRWLTVEALQHQPEVDRMRVAAAAYRWYEGHSLQHHLNFWTRALDR